MIDPKKIRAIFEEVFGPLPPAKKVKASESPLKTETSETEEGKLGPTEMLFKTLETEKCRNCMGELGLAFFLTQVLGMESVQGMKGDCEKCHSEVGGSYLEAFGLREHTTSFKVKWRVGEDRKIYITTPFYPGRQPWNYGQQEGPTPGATGESTIELVVYNDPNDKGFEQA